MAPEVIVTDEAFPYLVAQRGALDGLKGDRAAWEAAYRRDLSETFEGIRPHLPGACFTVLDVGGGMGGIDVLVSRQYGAVDVEIIDGRDGNPAVERHATPFSHAAVARRFLAANGVHRLRAISPEETRMACPVGSSVDLVLSFAAWCFHIEPAVYLSYVRERCRAGTVVILDLRKDRKDWAAELAAVFTPIALISAAHKYLRMVYVAR